MNDLVLVLFFLGATAVALIINDHIQDALWRQKTYGFVFQKTQWEKENLS